MADGAGIGGLIGGDYNMSPATLASSGVVSRLGGSLVTLGAPTCFASASASELD